MTKSQTGVALIEAMIAVFLIAVGLLGLSGLSARALSLNQSAYYKGIAVDLGVDLSERIASLRTPFLVSADATPKPTSPPDFSLCVQNSTADPTCTAQSNGSSYGSNMQTEMNAWNSLRISQLPAGSTYTLSAVQSGTSAFYRYTLVLTWMDDRVQGTTSSYSVVIE